MPETTCCPECEMALAPDAPRGICPYCLFKQALEGTIDMEADGSPLDRSRGPAPTPEELAAEFPELEILRRVGRGGMGVVYEARHRQLDRKVALKILSPAIAQDPAFAERFAREAKVMAMLTHPHIVGIYEIGKRVPSETNGRNVPLYFFLMEYVDGLTLRQLLDSGELTPQQAFAIVPQICEALQYAHNQGVVHRDIKPENILMDRQGNVKIADFGLAKLMGLQGRDLTISTTGQVLGTLHYMAPEQMERPTEVDHRADIYSLGVVFYQMLTGELPLGRFAPPSKRVPVDARLDEVVLRALEKEPARRYQQASALQNQVETIAAGEPELPVEWREPRFPWVSALANPLGIVGLGLMAFLLLVFAAGFAYWRARLPIAAGASRGTAASLADLPHELNKARTDEVIRAGLEKPLLPWAWQELERRPITAADADAVMDGLTAWLKRDYPDGMTQPLAWVDEFLKKMDQHGLIAEPRKIAFLEALHGRIRGDQMFRLREGPLAPIITPHFEWRATWNRELLGLTMMNELQSVTLDGKPLPLGELVRNLEFAYALPLRLPTLDPGKHSLKLFVLSALIPSADLIGLKQNTGSADWPPAKKSWERTVDVEITVYAKDAEIITAIHDPSMNPAKHGLSLEPIMIRGGAANKNATLQFAIDPSLSTPIAFNVSLRLADQTIPCGPLWALRANKGGSNSDPILTVDIPAIGPEVKEAEVILTPNPQLIELRPDSDRFWGEEVRFRVGLRRLDDVAKDAKPEADPLKQAPQAQDEFIQVGDSLAQTIQKLARHGIEVHDSTPAIEWNDGKDRRLYRLSHSRNPKDALTLVALPPADGRDTDIEEMYWDIDFIKRHVPKADRPPDEKEPVDRVQISDLTSELN